MARLHILTVVSSDAEAMIRGLSGEVARSLIPYQIVRRGFWINRPQRASSTYTAMANKSLRVVSF